MPPIDGKVMKRIAQQKQYENSIFYIIDQEIEKAAYNGRMELEVYHNESENDVMVNQLEEYYQDRNFVVQLDELEYQDDYGYKHSYKVIIKWD